MVGAKRIFKNKTFLSGFIFIIITINKNEYNFSNQYIVKATISMLKNKQKLRV